LAVKSCLDVSTDFLAGKVVSAMLEFIFVLLSDGLFAPVGKPSPQPYDYLETPSKNVGIF